MNKRIDGQGGNLVLCVSLCVLTLETPETVQPGAMAQPASSQPLPHIQQQLRSEECYHGKLSRKAAESLLVKDGDFLVRESATSPGQYVLSGLQGGQAKHLLLVDPEGKVPQIPCAANS